MEWMRCNSCWLKYEAVNSVMFHLTQCGHIFCDKCIGKGESRCCQCESTGTISLPLKEPLSPQIAHFFTPPSELLDKIIQAEQFQQAQMALCLKRADENENKYQSLKEAYWVSAENLKKIYHKYNKLKITFIAMQKDRSNTSLCSMTPSKYYSPKNQINRADSRKSYSQYIQGNQNQLKNTEQIFRVPTTTKVPRSAGSGYYSASASLNSSHLGLHTPNSHTSKC